MTIDLRLGDCLDLMRELPDASVDAVITDPPYGLNIANNPFRQKFEKRDWDAIPATDQMIQEVRRISRRQIIWGGNYFNLPPHQCFLIWDKKQSQDFSSAMVEQAWTNLGMPAKIFKRAVTSYTKEHPTQKPVDLMMWCIAEILKDADVILDPFMGSGTTGVACVKLNRNFIGYEINPEYFEIAKKRIADAQKQMILF